ncbi:MAG: transcription elongation factor GreA [Actinomycetota bacterium]|jgi:transcription elongation factor GreA|nr:transcription elongation factor GreA [Actinomycetota bacterium]
MSEQSETKLSPTAHKRLSEELTELTTKGRIDVARTIEAARALGDLSENGDYHAAKDHQGKMETRIRQLQHILKNATIVDEPAAGGAVTIGSVVSLRYEGDDDVERFLIGSIEEKHPDLTVISDSSPLGKALEGHNVGEVVEYEVPSGAKLKVEIVEVGGL